ncbi:MAG: hypothetical protein ACRDWH_02610 [Acidimicrobiia bacterium]
MTLAVSLIAVLLFVIALVVWQHGRRAGPREVTFGIENAVSFIETRLDEGVSQRLGPGGVRRVVEWEVFYLQGLAQDDRREPVETVAGDYGPAVAYIQDQISRTRNRTYSAEDIGAVLALGVAYLESIGAIGEEAGGMIE